MFNYGPVLLENIKQYVESFIGDERYTVLVFCVALIVLASTLLFIYALPTMGMGKVMTSKTLLLRNNYETNASSNTSILQTERRKFKMMEGLKRNEDVSNKYAVRLDDVSNDEDET